jgi:hypothetical protein
LIEPYPCRPSGVKVNCGNVSLASAEAQPNTAPLRGIFDVHRGRSPGTSHPNPDKHRGHDGGGTAARRDGVRVFTCACGKVQPGTFCGSRLVPSKSRCLVPPPSAYSYKVLTCTCARGKCRKRRPLGGLSFRSIARKVYYASRRTV